MRTAPRSTARSATMKLSPPMSLLPLTEMVSVLRGPQWGQGNNPRPHSEGQVGASMYSAGNASHAIPDLGSITRNSALLWRDGLALLAAQPGIKHPKAPTQWVQAIELTRPLICTQLSFLVEFFSCHLDMTNALNSAMCASLSYITSCSITSHNNLFLAPKQREGGDF